MSVINKRLGAVMGAYERYNDVITAYSSTNTDHKDITVYFGGDVQDYPENMQSHRDNIRWVDYNLVETALKIHKRFPQTTVFVIRPARIEFKTFSCFNNFIKSDKLGAPTFETNGSALLHLFTLLHNARGIISGRSDIVKDEQKPEGSLTSSSSTKDLKQKNIEDIGEEQKNAGSSSSNTINDLKLHNIEGVESLNIVGFSKGCVVLNQLIIELNDIQSKSSHLDIHLATLWDKVKSIYWLDGGHSGGKNTWITNEDVLKNLASLRDLAIHVHVTPYQVQDTGRPWIGKECKIFRSKLTRFGSNISHSLHYSEEEGSLQNHFRLLDDFI